jgi:hypothetical protein
MAIAIISFICGAVVFVMGFIMEPTSAPQQTIQYLVYVCSTIFFATGLICIKLHSNNNVMVSMLNNSFRTLEHKIEK